MNTKCAICGRKLNNDLPLCNKCLRKIRINNNKSLIKLLKPITFNIGDSPNNKENSEVEIEALTYTEELESMIENAGLYCERIPKIKCPTNKEAFENGIIVDDWPCDINVQQDTTQSNAGIENVVLYDKQFYSIITSWYFDDEKPEHIWKEDEKAVPVDKDFIEDRSILKKLKEVQNEKD